MFKLAVITDEVSQDFQRAADVAVEYGLDALEIRSVWNKNPQDLNRDEISRIRGILEDTGLEICGIAGPFFKCELDSPEEIRQHHDILRRCIALGKAVGCDLVRGFTFWRHGVRAEDVWTRIIAEFEEAARIVETEDAIIGIENEHSTFLGTGQVTGKFLDDLAAPRVKAIWDPLNSLADAQVYETPFPDGYEAIKKHMIHMHVKDGKRNPEGSEPIFTCVGEGEIGFKAHFEALVQDGYDGYVSLETHWRLTAMEGVDIQRPSGEKFSASGEEASRKCLDYILKAVSEL